MFGFMLRWAPACGSPGAWLKGFLFTDHHVPVQSCFTDTEETGIVFLVWVFWLEPNTRIFFNPCPPPLPSEILLDNTERTQSGPTFYKRQPGTIPEIRLLRVWIRFSLWNFRLWSVSQRFVPADLFQLIEVWGLMVRILCSLPTADDSLHATNIPSPLTVLPLFTSWAAAMSVQKLLCHLTG